MLDTRHMWIALALLAGVVFATDWSRRSSEPRPIDTTTITVRQGGEAVTKVIGRADCVAMRDRVWAQTDAGAECIAYLLPEGGISGSTAIVYFEGDVEDQSAENDARMVANYRRATGDVQARYGVPLVVIGRPGLMGSSGYHLLGGRRDEGEILNAAVDALKQKLGLARLILAGQSGGARVSAQLLTLGRSDVVCAAMGSGAYDVPGTTRGRVRTNVFGEPGQRYLVPLRQVQQVVPSRERRLFVIGDPSDTRAPFAEQRQWAEALQGAGHHAVLLVADGAGPEHHGLARVALQVAGLCAAGKSDAEIAAVVARQRSDRATAQ